MPADDPVIRKAISYLRGLELDKTYSVALQTMALCAAEPKKDMLLIRRNVQWLEAHQIKEGPRKGCWSYPGPGGDNSNAQFAVLALYDAQRVGVDVSRETWELSANYWSTTQNDDGSWGYEPGDAGTGSMTCAGIGAWRIGGRAESGDAAVENGNVVCCRPHEVDDNLDRAIVWLGKRFHRHAAIRDPRAAGSHAFTTISMAWNASAASLPAASSATTIGTARAPSSSFASKTPSRTFGSASWHAEDNPHVSTSLALLFLSKGRRPILLAKVKHGPDEDWNNHRRDVANLTAYTEEAWGLDLTWQVIDPPNGHGRRPAAGARAVHQRQSGAGALPDCEETSRLYRSRRLHLRRSLLQRLAAASTSGFRQFLDRVFPEGEYKLRLAARASDLADARHGPARFALRRPAVGVEYGCRTCVVFSDVDLSCYWELARPRPVEAIPERPSSNASTTPSPSASTCSPTPPTASRKAKSKAFERRWPTPTLTADAPRRHRDRQAPPRRRLQRRARRAASILLRTASQGELKLQVRAAARARSTSPTPICSATTSRSCTAGTISASRRAERTQLREYLERGGTLFADSICASKEFAAAFRREMQRRSRARRSPAFPPTTRSSPPPTAASTSARSPSAIRKPPPTASPVAARVRQVEPQLEGIELDGRWAVIFSPYDISCALESHEAIGCRGYTREDAARIGLNVLLYSLNQ